MNVRIASMLTVYVQTIDLTINIDPSIFQKNSSHACLTAPFENFEACIKSPKCSCLVIKMSKVATNGIELSSNPCTPNSANSVYCEGFFTRRPYCRGKLDKKEKKWGLICITFVEMPPSLPSSFEFL